MNILIRMAGFFSTVSRGSIIGLAMSWPHPVLAEHVAVWMPITTDTATSICTRPLVGTDLHMTVYRYQEKGIPCDTRPPSGAQTEVQTAATPWRSTMQVHTGLRQDQLTWSIAGIDGKPDVLSELTWRHQNMGEIGLSGRMTHLQGWVLDGAMALGFVGKGEVQDSDYAGNGRTQEYSRTLSKTSGGASMDAHIESGYRLRWLGIEMDVLGGWTVHQQSFELGMTHALIRCKQEGEVAVECLPSNALENVAFDADSRYRANWHGPRLEMGFRVPMGSDIGLTLGTAREQLRYRGVGSWTGRDDFQHPDSFIHEAKGSASEWRAMIDWRWNKGVMTVGARSLTGSTDAGSDTTYFSEEAAKKFGGSRVQVPFNGAKWRSQMVWLSLAWPLN